MLKTVARNDCLLSDYGSLTYARSGEAVDLKSSRIDACVASAALVAELHRFPPISRAMACCSCRTPVFPTPLAEYARSMRKLDVGTPPMHFPMYTVPLSALLGMTKLEPHEELKARDALVEFKRTMGRAAFVSHQWLTPSHPDPDCKQMKILQEALKHAMTNLKFIPLDKETEVMDFHAKPLPTSKLFSEPLFFWYDYFSCPQDPCNSLKLSHGIASIPAYVHECSFFFALVPVLGSLEHLIAPSTWHARGWCRFERTCRELADDHSWIVVKSSKDLELIQSAQASALTGSEPVGEGLFTVDSDRVRLLPVLMLVLQRKMLRYLLAQDFPAYRALLNQQTVMLRGWDCNMFESPPGFEQETEPNSASMNFLIQNGFQGIHESDSCGWYPLHYAALKGDPSILQELLKLRADPNRGTKKVHATLGFEPGMSSLSICCFFKHNEAARLLLSCKAKVTAKSFVFQPIICAAAANNVEAVQILCEAGCSPLQRNGFGAAVFELAANCGGVEAVDELFMQGSAGARNATSALHSAMQGRGGAEVVHRLIDMRADVNDQAPDWFKRTAIARVITKLMVCQYRFQKVTLMNNLFYHAEGATPLMSALMTGHYEGAAALIDARADLHLRNSRGWTAADFVQGHAVPDCLQEAFEGNAEGCRQVSLLARGWVEMQF